MMKVTVIGAGNGGLTAAYVLAKNGNEVCIMTLQNSRHK